MFTATNEYQSGESRFTTEFKSGESSYLTISELATANHRWKCEKCEKLVVNLKELKLHKFDTASINLYQFLFIFLIGKRFFVI